MAAVNATTPGGAVAPAGETSAVFKKRITAAKRARGRYEPQWHMSQAFAAGRHWLGWHRTERRLVFPDRLRRMIDDKGLELYTCDLLTQYMMTATAQLTRSGKFRPDLVFAREDVASDEFSEAANQALGYCWEQEAGVDETLRAEAIPGLLVYGTVGLRCRFDPTSGETYAQQVPHVAGQPILDPAQAQQAVAASFQGGGDQVTFKDLRGRITVEYLSPFQLLVPPGVADPAHFTWEVVVSARSVESVVSEWPHADGIQPQRLASIDMLGLRDVSEYETISATSGQGSDMGQPGELDGHLLVYTGFEKPSRSYPQGRTVVMAGAEHLVLEERPELPYRDGQGDPQSGLTYVRYWTVPNRFWGRGLIEAGIGIQRTYNRRRTQMSQVIDRGMPYVLVEEGALVDGDPKGLPMELVKLNPGRRPPQPVAGMGPGPWMVQELQVIQRDLEQAMGIRAVSLGENPTSVGTYSQLALLRQTDLQKMQEPIANVQEAARKIADDLLYDMKRYWPPDKVLRVLGPDRKAQTVRFTATQIPPAYLLSPASGAGLPRDQASELQKVNDLAMYARSVGQPLPLEWYHESTEAGKPEALPDMPMDDHIDKAKTENERAGEGQPLPPPQWYDPPELHMPLHLSALVRAELSGDMQAYQSLMMHVMGHQQQIAQQMAAQAAQAQQQAEQEEGRAERDQERKVQGQQRVEQARQQGGQG